jgi:hypothetical protein
VAADDVRHFEHDALARSTETVDQVRQRIGERVTDLLGEVGVDLRGTDAPVTECVLNNPQIDAGFQQMRRVRMAQCVYVSALRDSAPLERAAERTLQTAAREWAAIMCEAVRVGAGNSQTGDRCVRQKVRSSERTGVGRGT